MQAVILAGGQGTRLFPLTLHTPKPLIPIVGRPLLAHLIPHLVSQGIDEVFVTSGYLGEVVRTALAARSWGIPVHMWREAVPRGTAGAVRDLLPRLHPPFLVVSGDVVTGLDLAALLAAHRRAGASATLAVMPAVDRLRFGVVEMDGGRITRFTEKPGINELVPGLHLNSGVYVLEGEALAGVARDRPADFARDTFPQLLAGGHRLAAAATLRFWRDVGTGESFRDAHFEALNGEWPWETPDLGAPASVGPGVRIEGRVGFGRDVSLGTGSRIHGPAYLGDGVRLAPGSEVTRSVLLPRSGSAGPCLLQDTVVDAGVRVPSGAAVSGALLGRLAPVAAARPARHRLHPVPRGSHVRAGHAVP